MAKIFNVTLPTNSASLKLRAKQKVDVTYTVSNLSGRNVRGRVVLKPDDPAVKNKWVTLPKESEKDFEASSTFQFTVTMNLPADAAPGKYTFRLDAVNADIPDEGDPGPTVGFEVIGAQPHPFPKWIIPVAAVVLLLVAGTVTWLLLRKPDPTPIPVTTVSPTPTPIQVQTPTPVPPPTPVPAPEFQVTRALLRVAPSNYQGPCPALLQFEGVIAASGKGSVSYTFTRSDGVSGPTNTLEFDGPGSKLVNTSWTLGGSGMAPFEGWQAIKIVSPNPMESNDAAFMMKCEAPAPAPTPTPVVKQAPYYRLQLKAGGQYLDADHCSATISLNPGSSWDGGSCQLWRLVPAGDGWSRIQLKAGGQYLDADHCSAKISLNPSSNWDGGSCQLWRLVPAP